MIIFGVDLAWGEKKSDGVCVLETKEKGGRVAGYDYPHGDGALVASLGRWLRPGEGALACVDAPIVCPNLTGARPVDRLTHRLFREQHAGCHPANATQCARPPRVMARLAAEAGFRAGWDVSARARVAAEVYPHPAMVRLFGLPRIIKYKRGKVGEKRAEFRRLQGCMRELLGREFGELEVGVETVALLDEGWSKPVEDRTDALFCALIGWWHWRDGGRRSEVIGDVETGFILLPKVS